LDNFREDEYYWDKYERIREKNKGLISGGLKVGVVSLFLAFILSGVNSDIYIYFGVIGAFALFMAFTSMDQVGKAKRLAKMDPNSRRGFLEQRGRNYADGPREERRSRNR